MLLSNHIPSLYVLIIITLKAPFSLYNCNCLCFAQWTRTYIMLRHFTLDAGKLYQFNLRLNQKMRFRKLDKKYTNPILLHCFVVSQVGITYPVITIFQSIITLRETHIISVFSINSRIWVSNLWKNI